jgi:hypothetical protein
MAPKVPDAIAAVAEPSAAWPLFQSHLHRLSVRVGAAFAKPIQDALKNVANIGLHFDVLVQVNRHLFEFHGCGLLS